MAHGAVFRNKEGRSMIVIFASVPTIARVAADPPLRHCVGGRIVIPPQKRWRYLRS
jgi:hypothetical protein